MRVSSLYGSGGSHEAYSMARDNSDALSFRLDDGESMDSEEVRLGVILDFDVRGQMVGIEIPHLLSTRVDHGGLNMLQFETR